jgi:hypothetical protein
VYGAQTEVRFENSVYGVWRVPSVNNLWLSRFGAAMGIDFVNSRMYLVGGSLNWSLSTSEVWSA